jgi:hypothetical protein
MLLTLTWLNTACAFDPVVRPPKPEQLSHERVEVLSTLDARGEYALLAYQAEEGAPRVAISRWRTNERCDLPFLGEPIAAPLPRAHGGARTPALYVPLALSEQGETTLMLVDEHCKSYGPFGAIEPRTARTVISEIDGAGYLLYRDGENRLSVLDPRRGLTPRALADDVTLVRATREARGKEREALWIIAAGELRLLTVEGEALASVGSDVTTLTVSRDRERIAFVAGEDLYEAIAPKFAPERVASDACAARYGSDTLEFFAPCEENKLQRVKLTSGKYEEFADGVFASFSQEGVRLDYSKDLMDGTVLNANFSDGKRITVEPTLDAQRVYVLDERRIAGLTDEQQFGMWNRGDERFTPWLDHVAQIIPHHRGKKHTFAWLIHHEVVDALGTLTLLDQDGNASEIARDVPLPAQQGFVVEGGSALAQYPFSAPLVVLLEDAYANSELPVPDEGPPERFCGRLKALAITGAPRANLADDVCSYAIVAAPVPGVLFSVAAGARQGLWFVAL